MLPGGVEGVLREQGGSMKQVVLAVTAFLVLANAYAAGFDCARASTRVEKLICGDAELSRLDEQLNAAYKDAIQDKTQAAPIRKAQRQWLDARNRCGNAECLRRSYLARLQALAPEEDGAEEDDCRVCRVEAGIQEREAEVAAALSPQDAGLFAAVENGDRAAVVTWLAKGANVNARHGIVSRLVFSNPDDTYTSLHVAAAGKSREMVELLLDKGAYVDAKGENGATPLAAATCFGTKDIVALLLQKGADINVKSMNQVTGDYTDTFLHIAARCGRAGIAALLIAKGMDVNAVNGLGKTPLAVAIENRHGDVASVIRAHGGRK
jgi:uncharacterized protein